MGRSLQAETVDLRRSDAFFLDELFLFPFPHLFARMSRNSKQNSRAPSGASTPAVVEAAVPVGPVCAAINFGQSFSSIAIINKVRRRSSDYAFHGVSSRTSSN